MYRFLPLLLLFALFCQRTEAQRKKLSPEEQAAKDEKKQSIVDAARAHIDEISKGMPPAPKGNTGIRFAFYNVENYFDVENDSLKRDDDFTPEGMKAWTYRRYREKQENIYRTLMAMGGWDGPPAIVGLCEVENRFVLEDLLRKTPLKKYNYDILHKESPDRRGIDVGLFYRKDKFEVLVHESLLVRFPFDTSGRTRDILYAKGVVLGQDTIHLFINHWPSRWGGQAKSEPRRMYAASVVRAKVDSIQRSVPDAAIVIIGDFNDEYEDKSILEVLRAKPHREELQSGDLYNYTHQIMQTSQFGSHKYQGHWGTLDHIIVSQALLKQERRGGIMADPEGGRIFAARFLLEEDRRNTGLQPFRTYIGAKYAGGFSDHLPVFLDLFFNGDPSTQGD